MARHTGEKEELMEVLVGHHNGEDVGLIGIFEGVAGAVPTRLVDKNEIVPLKKQKNKG